MHYRFSDLEVDVERRRVSRGGDDIDIEPQPFDLLVFLIERGGQVVTKKEIIDGLWGGIAISDAALTTRIRKVRLVIDPVNGPSHIRTIHRVGYRFETDVSESERAGLPDPLDHVAAPVAGDASSKKPTIAILPFDNMSSDPEQSYFADGITEDITTELARFKEISVVGRNSAFALRTQQLTIKEYASRLDVRYILEGSVRRSGDRLRVTAQLIDASADKHLWAEKFDRDVEDIFNVQDEITQAIVQAISPSILRDTKNAPTHRATENLGSWDHHKLGLWHGYSMAQSSLITAAEHFREAARIDPAFVEAHAYLARSLCVRAYVYGPYVNRDRDLAEAEAAIATAIALGPDHANVWIARATYSLSQVDFDGALNAAHRANELTPMSQDSLFILGHVLVSAGKDSEALHLFDQYLQLGSHLILPFPVMAFKAVALMNLGRVDEAIDIARTAQHQPNADFRTHLPEISALALKGLMEEAETSLLRACEMQPNLGFAFIRQCPPFDESQNDRPLYEGLRAAGFPD